MARAWGLLLAIGVSLLGRRHVGPARPWPRARGPVRLGACAPGGSGVQVLHSPPGLGRVIPRSRFTLRHNFAQAQVWDALSLSRNPRAAPAPV